MDCSPPAPLSWSSPGKNTAVGCHFLLQREVREKQGTELHSECYPGVNRMRMARLQNRHCLPSISRLLLFLALRPTRRCTPTHTHSHRHTPQQLGVVVWLGWWSGAHPPFPDFPIFSKVMHEHGAHSGDTEIAAHSP